MNLILFLLFSIQFLNCFASYLVDVKTNYGTVRGTQFESYRLFSGLPFAAPPIGNLRFASPQKPKAWSGIYNATTVKPGCLQSCDLPPGCCPAHISEDCLYLDVFTPANVDNQKLPVLLFFPGGAFFQGSPSVPLYDSRTLTNRTNVIIINASYRLGALGALVHRSGSGYDVNGNFNIQDQRQAMRWVQSEVAAFGGDPDKVTIFGQSAGAMSVGVHLISPESKGLFRAAIMESNPLALPYKTKLEQSKWGKSFASHLGCSDLNCMRQKSASELIKAELATFHLSLNNLWEMALLWTPVIDGKEFPKAPLAAFEAGLQVNVPVMIGTVQTEGLIFVKKVLKAPISGLKYDLLMGALFGPLHGVLNHYPASSAHSSNHDLLAARVVTDYVFQCSTRLASQQLAKHNNGQTWLYRFDHAFSFGKRAWGADYAYCDQQTCHGGELPFVFGSAPFQGDQWTPAEATLSAQMQTYWGNFATNLTPNGRNTAGVWPPAVHGSNSTNILFKTGQLMVDTNYNHKNCLFWNGFYHLMK
mmetsp:Transcript_14780/g.25346  ORF Transcript_14780/g.25346 Transcript_14780/m.25346 type:complete len:530 (+) Transcript_14780:59-1648(+)